MTECNSHKANNKYPNLNSVLLSTTLMNAVPLDDQQHSRLN